MEASSQKQFLTVRDVADLLRQSREWVYALVESGKLAHEEHRLANRGLSRRKVILIPLDEFLAYARAVGAEGYNRIAREAEKRAKKRQISNLSREQIEAVKRRYTEDLWPLDKIAGEFQSHASTVRDILESEGVPIRSTQDAFAERRRQYALSLPEETREYIVKRYVQDQAGMMTIAEEIGWTKGGHSRVRRILQGLDIPIRVRGPHDRER